MTKFVDSLGLKRLVTKIAEAVSNGTWLPVKKGEGEGAVVVGENTNKAIGNYSYAEGSGTTASGHQSHAEGSETQALGFASHAEGLRTIARGYRSHTEGQDTCILSTGGHAQGMANYHTNDLSVIHDIGIGSVVDSTEEGGTPTITRLSAEAIVCTDDNKNGYKYMIGVGGYKGQAIGTDTKSVQEVIADLEKGVSATETMTVEEIRKIMGA
jgi:hypothetical protein